jgi:hypothetical protein
MPIYCDCNFLSSGDDQDSPSELVNRCVSALRIPRHGTNIERGKYLLPNKTLSVNIIAYTAPALLSAITQRFANWDQLLHIHSYYKVCSILGPELRAVPS